MKVIKLKTYDKIMENTYKLFLKKGFHNVSSSDISETSNISQGTLYYYFKNKDELILSVLDKYILGTYYEYLNNANKSKGNSLTKLKSFYIEMLGLNKDYTSKLEHDDDFKKILLLSFEGIQHYKEISKNYNKFNKKYTIDIKNLIDSGKENGEIRLDICTEELAMFIKFNINGIFFLWIVQEDFNCKKIIETNLKHVWDYIQK
ncbi:MAG: TetR/AcrR family transcriptional regulator [Methanobacteriaceae archaeon]|nr:TetR/AcrR family transcriptional regulator [Methanobacteriaceae archaeon]